MRHTALVACAAATLLLACAGGTDPEGLRPGPPAFIALVGGPLSATVGTTIDVTVKVTDAQGTAVPGYLVNFVIVSGGGSLFVTAVNTSPAGEAKNRWTLGTRAGEQAIEVRAIDPATGAAIVFERVTATALPGPVAILELHRESAIGFVAGEARDAREVIRRAADEYGNAVPDPPVTVAATGGWTVSGTMVTPPAPWQEAQLTVTSASLSRTLKARSVPNWRSTRFTASYACYEVDTDTSSPTLAAELVVDSIRYGRETTRWPNESSGPPFIGIMFASGTQRRPDGSTTPLRREIALVYPSPDSIVYGVPFFEPDGKAMLPGSFATYTARRESAVSKRFIGGTWCPGPDVLTRPNRLVLVEP